MFRNAVISCLLCLYSGLVCAQEIEPRAYTALPKNLNIFAVGYGETRGNVLVDPVLPVSDLKILIHNLSTGYLRTFGIAGKLARVQVTLPYISATSRLKVNGLDTGVTRTGLGDARIRLGVNLVGEPLLDKKEFLRYTENTIVGASLLISAPIGLYSKSRSLNCGSNRWGFKPEVGISKRIKRIYLEAYGGVWFYTLNDQFMGNKVLKQKPVITAQAHGSYFFKNKMMVSFNTTWFSGGRIYLDEVESGDMIHSFRVGATWSVPIARRQSIKLQGHIGAITAAGYDYNAVTIVYQYVF